MPYDVLFQPVSLFILVFFRVAGMMMVAPLFGSGRVPQRVRLLFALVVALGMMPAVPASTALPDSPWVLAGGIASELVFGLAIGTALSFIFIALSWAGEIIGQQMGLGIGAVFDPQSGMSGSAVGDLYFMLTLAIFMIIGGHRVFLRAVFSTFETVPLLSAGITPGVFAMVVGLLSASTSLAIQLAAPILVTMLVVDVVLGFLSKTVPQINILSAGLSLRAVVGLAVLLLGLAATSELVRNSLVDALEQLSAAWT
jgi:flagellar biosynthetic protein FliR